MIIIKVNNLTGLDENCVVMLERLDKEIYFKDWTDVKLMIIVYIAQEEDIKCWKNKL